MIGLMLILRICPAADKLLCNKTFDITKNEKLGGYQRGLASLAYEFFDRL